MRTTPEILQGNGTASTIKMADSYKLIPSTRLNGILVINQYAKKPYYLFVPWMLEQLNHPNL